jgi:hypothetical protein
VKNVITASTVIHNARAKIPPPTITSSQFFSLKNSISFLTIAQFVITSITTHGAAVTTNFNPPLRFK